MSEPTESTYAAAIPARFYIHRGTHMSLMQTFRDGPKRPAGIPTGFKVIAVAWVTIVLGVSGAVIWVAAHFIAKFW